MRLKIFALTAAIYFGMGILLEQDFSALGLVFKALEAMVFSLILSFLMKPPPEKE